MFSFLSSQKMFMTSCASTPTALPTRPTSLANVIFSAWKILSQYFTVSATSMAVPPPFYATARTLEGRWYRLAVNDDGSVCVTDRTLGLELLHPSVAAYIEHFGLYL